MKASTYGVIVCTLALMLSAVSAHTTLFRRQNLDCSISCVTNENNARFDCNDPNTDPDTRVACRCSSQTYLDDVVNCSRAYCTDTEAFIQELVRTCADAGVKLNTNALPTSTASRPINTRPATTTHNTSHPTPRAAIIGGTIGGVAVLALIAGVWRFLVRRRRNPGLATTTGAHPRPHVTDKPEVPAFYAGAPSSAYFNKPDDLGTRPQSDGLSSAPTPPPAPTPSTLGTSLDPNPDYPNTPEEFRPQNQHDEPVVAAVPPTRPPRPAHIPAPCDAALLSHERERATAVHRAQDSAPSPPAYQ
ncbi:hypothetical protein C8J57DRAFT_1311744 [Mycena rebaudengoi]|nr:hypothetical protein C8J57DRAFT_1311744 [Mycena rebaudengoi]